MTRYKNLGGTSPITYYEIGDNSITVWFKNTPFTYPEQYIGRDALTQMCLLAKAGRGLATYINEHPHVKHGYER